MKNQEVRFCVALLHAGCIGTNRPDPEDVNWMDSLAELGFDILAASHSHRISGYKCISRMKDRPSFCFYGLGSLASGYAASPIEREGLIVVAGFDREGNMSRLEVRPVLLDGTGFGQVPDLEKSQEIIRRFQCLSEEIVSGSYRRRFYRDMSQELPRLYFREARRAYRAEGLRGLARRASRMRIRHVRRLVRAVIQ